MNKKSLLVSSALLVSTWSVYAQSQGLTSTPGISPRNNPALLYSGATGGTMPELTGKLAQVVGRFSDLIMFDSSLRDGHFIVKKARDPIPVAALFSYIEEGWSDQEIANLLGDIAPEDVKRVRDFIFELL